jgi:hypothetical protein
VSGLVFVQGVLAVLAAAWLSLMVGPSSPAGIKANTRPFQRGCGGYLLNLLPS